MASCKVKEKVVFLVSSLIPTAVIIRSALKTGKDAVSTLFVLFALSSLLVGATFFLLGFYELGSFVYFIPRHVIIGCIGGVGIFVTKSGFEVSTGIPWEWGMDSFNAYSMPSNLQLWGVALFLVLLLRVLLRIGMRRYSLFPPCYFVSIAPFFYCILALLPGDFSTSLTKARECGWFFSREESVPFTTALTVIDLSVVRWDVVFESMPTVLALTAFSIMHVPINVPSLGTSTSSSFDMNHELIVHGISNLLSGACGGLQVRK